MYTQVEVIAGSEEQVQLARQRISDFMRQHGIKVLPLDNMPTFLVHGRKYLYVCFDDFVCMDGCFCICIRAYLSKCVSVCIEMYGCSCTCICVYLYKYLSVHKHV
jgi:hypothetical protein